MAATRSQAISGVSVGNKNLLMVTFPSVSATSSGRLLGQLCDSIPLKINGIKLSALLFGLPAALIAVPLYLLLKLAGRRYVLTTHVLRIHRGLADRLEAEISLGEIAAIEVQSRPGQDFFKAADVYLLGSDGRELARLEAIPRAPVFRQNILEARDARRQVDSALATIQSRQPA